MWNSFSPRLATRITWNNFSPCLGTRVTWNNFSHLPEDFSGEELCVTWNSLCPSGNCADGVVLLWPGETISSVVWLYEYLKQFIRLSGNLHNLKQFSFCPWNPASRGYAQLETVCVRWVATLIGWVCPSQVKQFLPLSGYANTWNNFLFCPWSAAEGGYAQLETVFSVKRLWPKIELGYAYHVKQFLRCSGWANTWNSFPVCS